MDVLVALFWSFDHSKRIYTTCHIHPFTHPFTHWWQGLLQGANLLIRRKLTFSHHWYSHREQFEVKYRGRFHCTNFGVILQGCDRWSVSIAGTTPGGQSPGTFTRAIQIPASGYVFHAESLATHCQIKGLRLTHCWLGILKVGCDVNRKRQNKHL